MEAQPTGYAYLRERHAGCQPVFALGGPGVTVASRPSSYQGNLITIDMSAYPGLPGRPQPRRVRRRVD